MNDEQIPTITCESSSEINDDTNSMFKVGSSSSMNTDTQFQSDGLSVELHKNHSSAEELKPMIDSNQPFDKDYSPERDLEDLLSIVEPCQDASKASSEVDSGAASDSADTSCAQINLVSLTESEFTNNEDTSSKVSLITQL